jgi:predicted flap endonuclease-1-like 5' DNA nuclease
MGMSIDKIKGVSTEYAKTLREHGLGTTDKFLAATRTDEMRRDLAAKLNVSEAMILEHANRCDLARLKGIGVVFSNLLENAGVDTVHELSTRDPVKFFQKLAETNVGRRFSHRNPTLKEAKRWVAQAKKLPVALKY